MKLISFSITYWRSTLDLSFLKPLMESSVPTTNKQAKDVRMKVAESIRNLSEGMSSTTQEGFAKRFEAIRTVKQFDSVLNDLYDYCDSHKIWVKTM